MSLKSGSALCLQCALCCDGSLFTRAQLGSQELESARTLGMSISSDAEGLGFILPCHLLNGKSCTIYQKAEKPKTCSGFQCKLLQRYLTGQVNLETALATVRTARSLLAELQRLAPIGRDQRITMRGIRLLTTYLFTLPHEERILHTRFLDLVNQYIDVITREFVQTQEIKNENLAEAEVTP